MAAEFVRVYIPESDSDATVTRGFANAVGYKILDKDAVKKNGDPLPAKKHEPLGTPKNSPRNGGKADEATSNTEANKEATS